MATEQLLIADDIADRSLKGRLRSRLIRENAIEVAQKLKLDAEFIFVSNMNSKFLKKKEIALFTESFDTLKSSIENQFAKAQVPLNLKIKYGNPIEEILAETNNIEHPKMLIMGTQGNKGLKKILLGSVAEEVIRNCHLPILTLGPVAQEKKAVLKLDKNLQVLFLTDLSDSSVRAEAFVKDLCKQLGCPVVLIHSIGDQILKIRENFYTTGYIPFNMENMFNQMVEDAQRDLLRKNREWSKEGLSATTVFLDKEEPLDKSLNRVVTKKAGLLVMGTHGRNQIASSFLGSTARKFLLTSPIPIVIVRSQ